MTKRRNVAFGYRLPLLLVLALLSTLAPAAQPLHAQGSATNLIANPGLETNNNSWQMCGDATLVDAQATGVTKAMVHNGRYAAAIHYDTDDRSCGGEAFFDPIAQIAQSFTVPADAQDLAISFWYSRIGDPLFQSEPSLGTNPEFSARDVVLSEVSVDELTGWNLYRTELSLEELEAVRGRTLNLYLAIFTSLGVTSSTANASPTTSAEGRFFIDDVRIVAAIERTTASPLPTDLQSDDTRPIVYLDAALGGVARMNRDGSDAKLLYAGLNPVWSSAGDRIAVLNQSLQPETTTDPRVNQARISILSTVNANGDDAQEVFRTSGTPGARGPQDEVPALDVEIFSMDWSPDDKRLAVTICSRNRRSNGSESDAKCWVELIEVATGESLRKIEPAYRPNWGSDNHILFEDTDYYLDRENGIWEVDLTKNPPVEQLLVPGTGEQFDLTARTDNWAVWSPDNTKFVTTRDVAGGHLNNDGIWVNHEAIMLFARDDLIGELILLVDHGTEPSGLTWSPDGKYLFYNLIQGEGGDIWWLNVNSSATGKVTSNMASLAPNWRPDCPAEPCSDVPAGEAIHIPFVEK